MSQDTLQSLVERLPLYGNRPAVGLRREYGVYWWSFQQLYDRAFVVAAYLRDRSISAGQPLMLWAPNTPEWVAFLLGASLRGAVVVPVDPDASSQYVDRLAREVRPALLVHGPGQDASALDLPTLPLHTQLPKLDSAAHSSVRMTVKADEPALILYTSGTTKQPKGVILTHRNLLCQVEPFYIWRWPLRLFQIRLLCLSPLSHVQGLLLGLCLPLALGLTVLYSDAVHPARILRTVRQNRVSLLLAVPRLQHLLARALEQMPVDRQGHTLAERVDPVRFFLLRRFLLYRFTSAVLGRQFGMLLVGGATLPFEDERFWYECGYFLVQGYGLTETAGLVSLNLNNPFSPRMGSIGKPLAHEQVYLAEDGELLVQGPNVTPGYFRRNGAPAHAEAGTWLHTGDLARWDKRKRLHLIGRKKEVVITGEGFNVYPEDVEAALTHQPQVRDALVFGLPRAGHEQVHAVLLTEANAPVSWIVRQANQELEAHQQIRSWTVWPEADFPRTALLKPKREEVAERVKSWERQEESAFEEVEGMPSLERIRTERERGRQLELLARYIMEMRVGQEKEQSLGLVEHFGLSSLDLVELQTLIEKNSLRMHDNPPAREDITLGELHSTARTPLHSRRSRTTPALQPAWSSSPVGSLLRSVMQPSVIQLWSNLCVRLVTCWPKNGVDISRPFILVAAPHRHWLDTFVLYSALPRRLRQRLVVVTSRDFHEHFAPEPDTSLRAGVAMGMVYYLLLPLVFSFIVLPNYGTTREGLYETGRLIDQGYSPLAFPKGFYFTERDGTRHDPGMALIALQTQLPILPAWLRGNDTAQFRDFRPRRKPPQVTVMFGEPIRTTPSMTPSQVIDQVEAAFQKLSSQPSPAG